MQKPLLTSCLLLAYLISRPHLGSSEGNIEQNLVEPLLQFTQNLFRETHKHNMNIIMSPLSVHRSLGTLLLGIKECSSTYRGLLKVLCYEHLEPKRQKFTHLYHKRLLNILRRLNGHKDEMDVWMNAITKGGYSAKVRFTRDLAFYYNASLFQANSSDPDHNKQLVEQVNKWPNETGFSQEFSVGVEKELSRAHFDMMLISSMKLNANWLADFEELKCEFKGNGNFIRNDSKCLKSKNASIVSLKAEAEVPCRAVTIPLKRGIKMTILEALRNDTEQALTELEDFITSEPGAFSSDLARLDELNATHKSVMFPSFKFANNLDLSRPLKLLGLGPLFEEVDLPRLSSSEKFMLNKVVHLAMVDTNELGFKSSGGKNRISEVTTNTTSPPKEDSEQINIKNPFMFIIRYERVPLFIGHVINLQ